VNLAENAPRLRVEGLVKEYPGTRVVDGVSFDLRAGEILGLIGENGAGKSTVIKMISGVIETNGGQVFIDEEPVSFKSAREAQRAGVGVVWQELSLVPFFGAAENVFLGKALPKTRTGLGDFRALKREAMKIFTSLETEIPMNVPVMELSPALQSMVAIARALATEARVFILDEPTAALTDTETRHLFKVLGLLRARGVGIIYISHRLQEILEITDRITVLRDGRLVDTVNTADVTMDRLINMMLGRTMGQMYTTRSAEVGEPFLEVSGLAGPGVVEASFVLRRGEILGISGLAGSGRTEVLNMLAGAAKPTSGTVTLSGKPYKPGHPKDALKAGVSLVPEERRSMGLILGDTISNNLVMSNLRAVSRAGLWLHARQQKNLAKRLVMEVGVKTTGVSQAVEELSGGNQQKVVLGKCLSRKLEVLLLDEPTRGVDVGSKHEIYEIIRRVAASGTGIVVVSSDLPEIVSMSDRIVVMKGNSQAGIVNACDVDEEKLLTYCHLGVPG
jgi:ABC-type sugar transport system ATPase subunit